MLWGGVVVVVERWVIAVNDTRDLTDLAEGGGRVVLVVLPVEVEDEALRVAHRQPPQVGRGAGEDDDEGGQGLLFGLVGDVGVGQWERREACMYMYTYM